MKKIISVFLAVLLIAGTLSITMCASAYDDYNTGVSDLPCVYIQGQGASIVTDDGRMAYGSGDPGDNFDLMAAVKDCLPYLMEALRTDEWETYQGKLIDIADEVYGLVRLDKNGDPQYGTHLNDLSWLADQYKNIVCSNGKYAMRAYNFYIDWRLDPFETADVLHQYIESVKAATGKDKINLTARCEGTNVAAAYVERYGADDINTLNLYIPTIQGSDSLSGVISGNLMIDMDALARYKDQELSIDDPFLSALLDSGIDVILDTYTGEALEAAIIPLIAKLYRNAVVPVLLASYGTMPGIWAMVTPEEYEMAKRNVFRGVEKEYAGLIAKLDNYNEKVRQCASELLHNAEKDGAKVSIWAKYGNYTMIPVAHDNNLISDGVVTLAKGTLGGKQTHIGKVFSDSYMEKAEANGTAIYISPDKVCDCSTAAFPDQTWVIYNSEHREFPPEIHEMIGKFIIANGNLTVFDDPTMPQYICSSDEVNDHVTLEPLTAENGMQRDTAEKHTPKTMLQKLMAFVESLINWLKNFIFSRIDSKD